MNNASHRSEKISTTAPRGSAASTAEARRASLIVCAAALCALAALGACSERQRAQSDNVSAEAKSAEAASASAQPINKPSVIPSTTSAADAKSAPAAFDSAALSGQWEGSFHAKKGIVTMPSTVKDKARAADDGKAAAGDGAVSLVIAPDGEISGNVKGALGNGAVRGKAEGGMIRVSMFPDDPSDPSAMRGTLLGIAKDSLIQAELRVSGPDASIVREAAFELKRK